MNSHFKLVQLPAACLAALALCIATFSAHAEDGHEHANEPAGDKHVGAGYGDPDAGDQHDVAGHKDASHDSDSHDEGHVALSAEQIERAGIGLSRVASGKVRETLPVYGVIRSNAEQVQAVVARFDGVIRAVHKRVGDAVNNNDLLLTVEANDSLNSYSIRSAISGVVTQRNANPGEQTAGRVLLVVEDLSTVWVELSVFPKDVGKLALGQQVRISSAGHAMVAEGSMIYIAAGSNGNSQVTTARVLLNNPDGEWKPGLFVNAAITLSETSATTVIHSEAVQLLDGKTTVFVQRDAGFEPVEVSLGLSDGDFSEVLSGLSVDDVYVSTNSFILKSEMGKEDAEHGH